MFPCFSFRKPTNQPKSSNCLFVCSRVKDQNHNRQTQNYCRHFFPLMCVHVASLININEFINYVIQNTPKKSHQRSKSQYVMNVTKSQKSLLLHRSVSFHWIHFIYTTVILKECFYEVSSMYIKQTHLEFNFLTHICRWSFVCVRGIFTCKTMHLTRKGRDALKCKLHFLFFNNPLKNLFIISRSVEFLYIDKV